jgi:hypothetical protein
MVIIGHISDPGVAVFTFFEISKSYSDLVFGMDVNIVPFYILLLLR